MMQAIPISILAGSDHKPGHLPESGANLHALANYKGAEVTLGGKPLIRIIVDRIRESGVFGPVTVAGPREVYGPLALGTEIVDTNGSVAVNFQATVEHHLAKNGEEVPLALMTYDIIPSAAELREVMALYRGGPPCALWMPFVRMPPESQALGPFAWKPSYLLKFEGEDQPVKILPGHLAIFYPAAIRMDLLYKLLDLAYQTRNHSLKTRRRVMLGRILSYLAGQDFRALIRLQAPRLTLAVLRNGLGLASGLRHHSLTVPDLEKYLDGMFLRESDRFSQRQKTGIRHPGLGILSLAEDIDTEEEARGVEQLSSLAK